MSVFAKQIQENHKNQSKMWKIQWKMCKMWKPAYIVAYLRLKMWKMEVEMWKSYEYRKCYINSN